MAVEVFASMGFKPLLFVLRYGIGALPGDEVKGPRCRLSEESACASGAVWEHIATWRCGETILPLWWRRFSESSRQPRSAMAGALLFVTP